MPTDILHAQLTVLLFTLKIYTTVQIAQMEGEWVIALNTDTSGGG